MSNASITTPVPAETKTEPRRRWRFQFSLRTLLIFVTLVAVMCACIRMFFHQYFIVRQIKELGGYVHYDTSNTYVVYVEFDKPVKNKDLKLLQDLPHLEYVFLRNPDITDEGLNIIIDLYLRIYVAKSNTFNQLFLASQSSAYSNVCVEFFPESSDKIQNWIQTDD